MALSKADRAILKNIFGSIPQVQAWRIITGTRDAATMAQAIILAAGIEDLNEDERRALHNFMLLDKSGREILAGELIGQAIEQSGIVQRIFKFLFGWLR